LTLAAPFDTPDTPNADLSSQVGARVCHMLEALDQVVALEPGERGIALTLAARGRATADELAGEVFGARRASAAVPRVVDTLTLLGEAGVATFEPGPAGEVWTLSPDQ
jgi:hypothetical protein